MSENVTASTDTRAETVFLTSIIEKNLWIPWGLIMVFLWIFIRVFYSNWAWEKILAREGNPAAVIPLQPLPSDAGDGPIFRSYSHLSFVQTYITG